MFTNLRRGSYVIMTLILVYATYYISLGLLKIGFNGASGEFFFIVLGFYLAIPLIKYTKIKKNVIEGELEENYKINKNLKKLNILGNTIEDATLKYKNQDIKIEKLVITKKGIFNIVKCNYTGDILIEEDNRWHKTKNKRKDALLCPINTIRNYRLALTSIFEEEEIIDLIVIVNDRIYIQGEEYSDVPIIRYDEILSYIEDYDGEEKYNEEELYERIYPSIVNTKNTSEDNKLYNLFLDYKWIFRSRLAFISVFLILYLLNIVYLNK
ncbi:hypothetical protein [Clostridium vincentii]|uniref:NERD domain-containing protein n=1 Tax=Clostridium vincentii TaxID=52704 RepID=A0A2T0BHY0_9CLOT|nr:hypothetical protein [Clostridium vincentii]PRR83412.1 hypothetical protein CLVI_09590 [Clostridium vincentii]